MFVSGSIEAVRNQTRNYFLLVNLDAFSVVFIFEVLLPDLGFESLARVRVGM